MCQWEKGFKLATTDAPSCSPPMRRRELEAVLLQFSRVGEEGASVMILKFTCREHCMCIPALAIGLITEHVCLSPVIKIFIPIKLLQILLTTAVLTKEWKLNL